MNYLRRYTDLPALLHLLLSEELTFLDPDRWDDRNDAYYLNRYRESNELETLLAICFTQAAETYHHWRVFCHGSSGVCLYFNHARLVGFLNKNLAIRSGPCIYRTMSAASRREIKPPELPYLKRAAFKDEREYRILFAQKHYGRKTVATVRIPLTCLRKIVVNPWMPQPLFEATAATIYSFSRGAHIEVVQSTLIDNERWKSFANGAA